jgi:UDP-glucose 4-epimerase
LRLHSVHGEPEHIPVDVPLRPMSVYDASKVACKSLIHAYTKLYDIKAILLRYANVVSSRLGHGIV